MQVRKGTAVQSLMFETHLIRNAICYSLKQHLDRVANPQFAIKHIGTDLGVLLIFKSGTLSGAGSTEQCAIHAVIEALYRCRQNVVIHSITIDASSQQEALGR